MMCGRGGDPDTQPCPGNAGSPLVRKRFTDPKAEFILEGVMSGVESGCSDLDLPDIFGRVSFVRDWIDAVTGL